MEQSSILSAMTHATEEYLRNRVVELEERVKTVEESHARVVQRDFSTAAAMSSMSESLKEWTLENFENGNITEEQAVELSEIGVFELTKEVEAEVSVTYYITVQVPAGESAEDIINDIDFDAIVYDTEHITNVSSSVDSVDI
jgi:hypothetical protein